MRSAEAMSTIMSKLNPTTQRDLGWTCFIGILFAISPLTGANKLLPSIVGGLVISGVFLWLRRRLRRRASIGAEAPGRTFFVAGPSLGVALLLGMTLVVFLPTLAGLYAEYTDMIWRNGHGLFVPLAIFLLARSRLRESAGSGEKSSALGIPILLAGGLLATLAAGLHSAALGATGIVVALPGLSLLLFGAQRTREIAGPLALSVFLIPLPNDLPDPLRLISTTAAMMEHYLGFLNVPVLRHQTAFKLPVGFFGVTANCSGIATFYAATFLAFVLAMTLDSWPRRIAIVLSPWFITVFFNGIRGTVLVGLCNRFGMGVLESPIHGLTGVATIWSVLLIVFLFADRPRLWKAIT